LGAQIAMHRDLQCQTSRFACASRYAMASPHNINFFRLRRQPQSSRPHPREDEVDLLQIPDFWSALTAIVVIDLVLAGDNAIVIAIAARNLPPPHRYRAIAWGTAGAVAVRAGLAVAALELLQLPGLMFMGGALLLTIAYRVLTSDRAASGDGVAPTAGLGEAMRTIVIADAAMGMDNVLGVTGAAQGNVPLVGLGLAISVPVVVWGSTPILECIERFPALLYAGGAVLAWTAAQMIGGEPYVHELLAAYPGSAAIMCTVTVAVALGAAWLRNRRLQLQSLWN
jgi:YjbE family integral membrane protein